MERKATKNFKGAVDMCSVCSGRLGFDLVFITQGGRKFCPYKIYSTKLSDVTSEKEKCFVSSLSLSFNQYNNTP